MYHNQTISIDAKAAMPESIVAVDIAHTAIISFLKYSKSYAKNNQTKGAASWFAVTGFHSRPVTPAGLSSITARSALPCRFHTHLTAHRAAPPL